jgi:hypothetical protein
VPEAARTEELDEIIDYFGAMVRTVDSSLLDEWERMKNPDFKPLVVDDAEPRPDDITREPKKFTALIRNLMYSFLRELENGDYESALDLVEASPAAETPADLQRAFGPLFAGGEHIRLDAEARSPLNTQIEQRPDVWEVTQNILVGEDVSEFTVRGTVDLTRSAAEKRPVFTLTHVGSD